MVRGPMMGDVTAGCSRTKPQCKLNEAEARAVGQLGQLRDGVELLLVPRQ